MGVWQILPFWEAFTIELCWVWVFVATDVWCLNCPLTPRPNNPHLLHCTGRHRFVCQCCLRSRCEGCFPSTNHQQTQSSPLHWLLPHSDIHRQDLDTEHDNYRGLAFVKIVSHKIRLKNAQEWVGEVGSLPCSVLLSSCVDSSTWPKTESHCSGHKQQGKGMNTLQKFWCVWSAHEVL